MANERKTEEIVEPHWPSMFAMARRIVDQQIEKDYGRDFVLEMLDFGKRMAEQRENGSTESLLRDLLEHVVEDVGEQSQSRHLRAAIRSASDYLNH